MPDLRLVEDPSCKIVFINELHKTLRIFIPVIFQKFQNFFLIILTTVKKMFNYLIEKKVLRSQGQFIRKKVKEICETGNFSNSFLWFLQI